MDMLCQKDNSCLSEEWLTCKSVSTKTRFTLTEPVSDGIGTSSNCAVLSRQFMRHPTYEEGCSYLSVAGDRLNR